MQVALWRARVAYPVSLKLSHARTTTTLIGFGFFWIKAQRSSRGCGDTNTSVLSVRGSRNRPTVELNSRTLRATLHNPVWSSLWPSGPQQANLRLRPPFSPYSHDLASWGMAQCCPHVLSCLLACLLELSLSLSLSLFLSPGLWCRGFTLSLCLPCFHSLPCSHPSKRPACLNPYKSSSQALAYKFCCSTTPSIYSAPTTLRYLAKRRPQPKQAA